MKIKLVFLLLFPLFYHNSKAQYEPMLNGTLYWYVTSCGFFCNTDHYFAKEELTIALPSLNTKPWRLNILDIHGQCFFEETLNELQTTINTQLWPSGLYLICLKHENECRTKK